MSMVSPAALPQVAVAVVAGVHGVLVGRRADGSPPWTLLGGAVEMGESVEQAAMREVREESGVAVAAVAVLGCRVHPATGRALAYVAAVPIVATEQAAAELVTP